MQSFSDGARLDYCFQHINHIEIYKNMLYKQRFETFLYRCNAKTRKGYRCSRKPVNQGIFCTQHLEKLVIAVDSTTVVAAVAQDVASEIAQNLASEEAQDESDNDTSGNDSETESLSSDDTLGSLLVSVPASPVIIPASPVFFDTSVAVLRGKEDSGLELLEQLDLEENMFEPLKIQPLPVTDMVAEIEPTQTNPFTNTVPTSQPNAILLVKKLVIIVVHQHCACTDP
jgi:hypothetical protein